MNDLKYFKTKVTRSILFIRILETTVFISRDVLKELHQIIKYYRDGMIYLNLLCAIIIPEGEVFSLGYDFHEIQNMSQDDVVSLLEAGYELEDIICTNRFPIIALISGPCIGSGMELALSCTSRIGVRSRNTYFQLGFMGRYGVFPSMNFIYNIIQLIGYNESLFYLFCKLGTQMNIDKALHAGLIDDEIDITLKDKKIDFEKTLMDIADFVEKRISPFGLTLPRLNKVLIWECNPLCLSGIHKMAYIDFQLYNQMQELGLIELIFSVHKGKEASRKLEKHLVRSHFEEFTHRTMVWHTVARQDAYLRMLSENMNCNCMVAFINLCYKHYKILFKLAERGILCTVEARTSIKEETELLQIEFTKQFERSDRYEIREHWKNISKKVIFVQRLENFQKFDIVFLEDDDVDVENILIYHIEEELKKGAVLIISSIYLDIDASLKITSKKDQIIFIQLWDISPEYVAEMIIEEKYKNEKSIEKATDFLNIMDIFVLKTVKNTKSVGFFLTRCLASFWFELVEIQKLFELHVADVQILQTLASFEKSFTHIIRENVCFLDMLDVIKRLVIERGMEWYAENSLESSLELILEEDRNENRKTGIDLYILSLRLRFASWIAAIDCYDDGTINQDNLMAAEYAFSRALNIRLDVGGPYFQIDNQLAEVSYMIELIEYQKLFDKFTSGEKFYKQKESE